MTVIDKITQERLQEILLSIYKKGVESENISVNDLIEDIKEEFLIGTKVTK